MQTIISGLQTAGFICVGLGIILTFYRMVKHEDTVQEAIKHTIVIVGFGLLLILISYGAEFLHNRVRSTPSEQPEESFLTEEYPFYVVLRRL